MLERSDNAKIGASAFFDNYNDINVFIEDTAFGYAKIFARIISRAMSQNIAIDRVFPLGGRAQVLAEARNNTTNPSKKPSIYIIDGDLYLLCGSEDTIPENTIELPRYCIENFLMDENALIQLADEESPQTDIENIRSKLSYIEWIESTKQLFQELFIMYATAHKLQSGIPTVSRGYKAICAGEEGVVDPRKVQKICNEIKNKLLEQHSTNDVEIAMQGIRDTINLNDCFIKRYVSAKDYSLPLLLMRFRTITKSKAPNINLKLRLSTKVDVAELAEVINRVAEKLNIPQLKQ